MQWLPQQSDAQLEIMADPSLAAVFEGRAEENVLIRTPGSLDHYRSWLNSLHIGLAPLLPTDYNRCRSDVKFLEYAAAGAVAVLQNETPYQGLAATGLANLFDSPETLIQQLEHGTEPRASAGAGPPSPCLREHQPRHPNRRG